MESRLGRARFAKQYPSPSRPVSNALRHADMPLGEAAFASSRMPGIRFLRAGRTLYVRQEVQNAGFVAQSLPDNRLWVDLYDLLVQRGPVHAYGSITGAATRCDDRTRI